MDQLHHIHMSVFGVGRLRRLSALLRNFYWYELRPVSLSNNKLYR
jgi:hypothetical protein